MNIRRGVSAEQLHGRLRHIYMSVDITASNWREYALNRANRLPHGGILHILEADTFEEIERMYV